MKQGHTSLPIEKLEELSETFQIPLNTVITLYNEHKNIESLTEFLKIQNKKEIPKITVFTNGILVKNRFYSKFVEENKKLIELLDNNEFDRDIFEEIFNTEGKEEDVIIEKIDREYLEENESKVLKNKINETEMDREKTVKRFKRMSLETNPLKTFKYVVGKGKVPIKDENIDRNKELYNNLNAVSINSVFLPPVVTLGQNPSIKFKIIYKNRETLMIGDEKLKIFDIIFYLQTTLNRNVSLLLAGEVLDSNETIIMVRNSLVDVID